jgi:hypothetical protein
MVGITMKNPLRVKIIARGQPSHAWARQTANGLGRWGDCQFLFDRNEDRYDWLVVIDDVSRKLSSNPEQLLCPAEHTLLVTTEPPPITHYGRAFCAQFHYVLTSQAPAFISHANHIHSTTGNLWFHGKNYDQLTQEPAPEKTDLLSTVCSSKQQSHTVHKARYNFTQWLKAQLPCLEIYGHGVRPITHKHDALDRYCYHLAIENHVALHHWTEKFADPLLSYCIPIYHGCPNIADYFPKDSYLTIDINEPLKALEIIRAETSDLNGYAKRIDSLIEARRLVLERHNLLAILNEHISTHHRAGLLTSNRKLFGKKQMRLKNPRDLRSHLLWKIRNSLPNKYSK